MIRVYCEHITPRHAHIFGFIFRDILGMDYDFCTDKAEFENYTGAKFSYGQPGIHPGLHFVSHPLLDETGIKPQQIRMSTWNGFPVFFQVEGPSALPFDPFALSFYLVTRYEEYLPFKPDEHGRFPAASSLAFREGFLRLPLVNVIADHLKSLVLSHFPGLPFPERSFRFIPTFDIDIAFAHLGKGFPRAPAAWMKLLLTGKIREMRERYRVMTGKMPDPFDNFRFQLDLAKQYGHTPLYFVLAGNFGRFDRNTSFKSRRFRELLQMLNRHAGMGIHPSYRSFMNRDLFLQEKARLEEMIGTAIKRNRFHYLRLRFPQSFRDLADAGINEDFSLGYSTVNGFRAGTCTPFDFYDLEKEATTGLKMHPFIFMDSAMIDNLHYSPAQALEEALMLTAEVEKYGGEAIGIWHNYALSEKDQYEGWQDVLKTLMEKYKTPSS